MSHSSLITFSLKVSDTPTYQIFLLISRLCFVLAEHETATSLLMHLIYLTAIFVAMIIMLSRNFALILAYALFFCAILGGNLLMPLLTPYLSMCIFLTSTVLAVTYIAVHLCAPLEDTSPKTTAKKRKHRATTGPLPPQAPPFPDNISVETF